MIQRIEGAGFFHTSCWAEVLKKTYGYRPVYVISEEDGHVKALMPLMEVRSLLTGSKGVSLPFTDICDLLCAGKDIFDRVVSFVKEYGKERKWKYIEWRGGDSFFGDAGSCAEFFGHTLDLTRSEQEIFASFRESNRRNINKAARDGVKAAIDNSMCGIGIYYRLHCNTRRMHGLPPQPFSFFKKIQELVINQGNGITMLAWSGSTPVAGAIFFHFAGKAVYKYGASERIYQHLRPNNLLMWEAVRYYSEKGLKSLDFGRTETENQGLLQFKRGWGTTENTIRYFRYDLRKEAFAGNMKSRLHGRHNAIFRHTPIPLLKLAGSILYRHIG